MDNEDLLEAILAYTSRHALEVRELLGSGIHGIVHVVESKTDPGSRAVKLHRDPNAYLREKMVYERLTEKRVDTILGFQVPVPLRFDDEFMAIEMTIVMPPFVLDFASASLDTPIGFSAFSASLPPIRRNVSPAIAVTPSRRPADTFLLRAAEPFLPPPND